RWWKPEVGAFSTARTSMPDQAHEVVPTSPGLPATRGVPVDLDGQKRIRTPWRIGSRSETLLARVRPYRGVWKLAERLIRHGSPSCSADRKTGSNVGPRPIERNVAFDEAEEGVRSVDCPGLCFPKVNRIS